MLTKKRRHGRPRGSGKDDSAALGQVADLLVQDSFLRPTTAMKRVLCSRNDWGAADPTQVRRWQEKWKRDSVTFMAAARERARLKATQARRDVFLNHTTDAELMESAMQTVIAIICHSSVDKISVTENPGCFGGSKLFDTREAADAYAAHLQAKAGGPANAEIRVHALRRGTA